MYSSSEAKYCTVLDMLFVCEESDSKLSNSQIFALLFDSFEPDSSQFFFKTNSISRTVQYSKGKDDNQTKEINKIKIAALVNIAVCRAMRDKSKYFSISDQKNINHICKR